MEKNKTSQYLKYALGEILLVMIGILLALQVNNWNEHRKKVRDERVLLLAVLDNIALDSLNLASVVEYQTKILDVHKKLIGIAKGSNTPDDIENLGLIRRSLPNSLTLKSNYPDLQKQVLDEKVKSAVMDYFQILTGYEFTMNLYNSIIDDNLRPFLSEKQLLNFGNQLEEMSTWINEPKFYQEFQKPELKQEIFNVGTKLNLITRFSPNWIKTNEVLKGTIQTYLNKE